MANFGLENDINSSTLYENFFDCLSCISSCHSKEEAIFSSIKFKLNLAKELGYEIQLDNCVRCSSQIDYYYNFFCHESGGLICRRCQSVAYGSISVKTETLESWLLLQLQTLQK